MKGRHLALVASELIRINPGFDGRRLAAIFKRYRQHAKRGEFPGKGWQPQLREPVADPGGPGHDTATVKGFPGAAGEIGSPRADAANRFATRILAVERQKRHCRMALMPPLGFAFEMIRQILELGEP
jgi:hypothetical protein